MDIKQISQIQQSFEGIVCGFGLPYLNKKEAIQLIQDAFVLLTKGGLLYLSTMEGDYSSSGWQQPSSGEARQMFIHFHEASYLIQALRNSGFQDIEVHMQDFPEANGVLTPEILLLAQKP